MADLIRAIKGENEAEIWKQLARKNVQELINFKSKDKSETPLFCASSKGNYNVVENLLEKGARVNALTSWGALPLHAASERGHLEIVRLLVQNGSFLDQQTQFGDTPAHLAAYRGHCDVVKFLVEARCDIFIKNSKRRTILDEASQAENARVVRYLERVVFGDESKPTIWRTPHRKNQDPMVTTNLVPPGKSHSNPSSPKRKPSVTRSHSSPFTDRDTFRFDSDIARKLNDLSISEVIHHPTVHIRDKKYGEEIYRYRPPISPATLDSNWHRAGHSPKDNGRSTTRPGSEILCNTSRSPCDLVSSYNDKLRARSLERMVTELQCGLSFTQSELERTKANLKAAKEKIDRMCASQKEPNNGDNREGGNRVIFRLPDT